MTGWSTWLYVGDNSRGLPAKALLPPPEPEPERNKAQFRPHRHYEAFHHPVILACQHVISPLSGSLLIFAVHKTWQMPSALASVRGAMELWRAGHTSAALHIRVPIVAAAVLAGMASVSAGLTFAASITPVPDLQSSLDAIYHKEDAAHVMRALSRLPSVIVVQHLLLKARETTGLPWWATIASATLGIRVAIAPINIALLRNSLRMKLLLPELNELGAVLARSGTTAAGRLTAAVALSALLRSAKANPFAQMIVFPLVLPPAILSVFGAVHNLAMAETSMAEEGVLWFPDLIERDKTQLLPIISALTWLWQVRVCNLRYSIYGSFSIMPLIPPPLPWL